jgi:hypothetical protein
MDINACSFFAQQFDFLLELTRRNGISPCQPDGLEL